MNIFQSDERIDKGVQEFVPENTLKLVFKTQLKMLIYLISVRNFTSS